jgi:hypothetical protein
VKKAKAYMLFKTQDMLLLATSKKGQPDADLHPVQNQEHALVSKNQGGPASDVMAWLGWLVARLKRLSPSKWLRAAALSWLS